MKTAKQINDPQCGEAWTAYMVSGTSAAEQTLEALFKAIGAKFVSGCSKCYSKISGEPWTVTGQTGRYCKKCACDLAREYNDKRTKKKSQRAGRSRRPA